MYSVESEVSETYILAKVQEADRAGANEMSHVSAASRLITPVSRLAINTIDIQERALHLHLLTE